MNKGRSTLKEPIRDRRKINQMLKWLRENSQGRDRDAMMFQFGLNTGLRIGDILKTQVKDVYNNGVLDYYRLKEKKTGKFKKVLLTDKLKAALEKYITELELDPENYLIFGMKSFNKPLDRWNAWRVLTEAAKECRISDFGTHTMRKTFGYWMYRETQDLNLVMQSLNHDRKSITLKYIGYSQEQIDEGYKKVQF